MENGHWMLLNNVHLMPKWLIEFEKWLEQVHKAWKQQQEQEQGSSNSSNSNSNSTCFPKVKFIHSFAYL